MLPTSSPRDTGGESSVRKRVKRFFSGDDGDPLGNTGMSRQESPSFAKLREKEKVKAAIHRKHFIPQAAAVVVLLIYLLYYFVLGTDTFWRHVDVVTHPPVACDRFLPSFPQRS